MKRLCITVAAGIMWLVAPAGAQTNAFCFPVGETMVYRLYWGILPVGRAEFSSQWTTNALGQQRLLLRAVARTTSVVARVYPVNDLIESTVDPDTFLPVRYVARLREGGHVRNDVVEFDHAGKRARWKDSRNGKSHDIEIDADTRDVLTLCYKMRTTGLSVGEVENFRVLVDDQLYDLQLKGQKVEGVAVKGFGEAIRCLKVIPQARFGEIFVRKGHVRLWFSEDSRRACVRMTGRLPIASVMATLVEVKGPGKDHWVRVGAGSGRE